jgi:hypothetical protein
VVITPSRSRSLGGTLGRTLSGREGADGPLRATLSPGLAAARSNDAVRAVAWLAPEPAPFYSETRREGAGSRLEGCSKTAASRPGQSFEDGAGEGAREVARLFWSTAHHHKRWLLAPVFTTLKHRVSQAAGPPGAPPPAPSLGEDWGADWGTRTRGAGRRGRGAPFLPAASTTRTAHYESFTAVGRANPHPAPLTMRAVLRAVRVGMIALAPRARRGGVRAAGGAGDN